MSNTLNDVRKAHQFNVVDDCIHEPLALNVGLSYFSRVVFETLEILKEERAKP
jgi:hypothetical protein